MGIARNSIGGVSALVLAIGIHVGIFKPKDAEEVRERINDMIGQIDPQDAPEKTIKILEAEFEKLEPLADGKEAIHEMLKKIQGLGENPKTSDVLGVLNSTDSAYKAKWATRALTGVGMMAASAPGISAILTPLLASIFFSSLKGQRTKPPTNPDAPEPTTKPDPIAQEEDETWASVPRIAVEPAETIDKGWAEWLLKHRPDIDPLTLPSLSEDEMSRLSHERAEQEWRELFSRADDPKVWRQL